MTCIRERRLPLRQITNPRCCVAGDKVRYPYREFRVVAIGPQFFYENADTRAECAVAMRTEIITYQTTMVMIGS